jgi:DNA-binding FadR family transcriptional regulator
MGLVESRQGSGTYVRADPIPAISRALTLSATTEERSILGLMELREPLDIAAARLASARRTADQIAAIRAGAEETAAAAARDDVAVFGIADNNFHHAIYQAADNPYLPLVLGAVRDIQSDVMELVVRVSGSMTIAAGQHQRIAAAIAAGDPDGAAAAMGEHVRYSADALLNVLALPAAERDELVSQLDRASVRA